MLLPDDDFDKKSDGEMALQFANEDSEGDEEIVKTLGNEHTVVFAGNTNASPGEETFKRLKLSADSNNTSGHPDLPDGYRGVTPHSPMQSLSSGPMNVPSSSFGMPGSASLGMQYGWDMMNLKFQKFDSGSRAGVIKHRIKPEERGPALEGIQKAFRQEGIQVYFENNPVGARLRTLENIELYLGLYEEADGTLAVGFDLRNGDYIVAKQYMQKITDGAKGISAVATSRYNAAPQTTNPRRNDNIYGNSRAAAVTSTSMYSAPKPDERGAALEGIQKAFRQEGTQVHFENNPVGAQLRTLENAERCLRLYEVADGSLAVGFEADFASKVSSHLTEGNSSADPNADSLSGPAPSFNSCAVSYGWDMKNLNFKPLDPKCMVKHRIPPKEREIVLRRIQEALKLLCLCPNFENNPVGAQLCNHEGIELSLRFFEQYDGFLAIDVQLLKGDYLDGNQCIHQIIAAAEGTKIEELRERDGKLLRELDDFIIKKCLPGCSPYGSSNSEPPTVSLDDKCYLLISLERGVDLEMGWLRRFVEVATSHLWLNRGPVAEQRIKPFFRSLVLAVDSAHHVHGISLNLDLSTILVHLKEDSSSFSTILVPHASPPTTRFAAPEVNNLDWWLSTREADLWSLGVILFELLTGDQMYDYPWGSFYDFWIESDGIWNTAIPLREMADTATNNNENNIRIQQFLRTVGAVHKLSNEAKQLLTSLLQQVPTKRISTQDILRHAWFNDNSNRNNAETRMV